MEDKHDIRLMSSPFFSCKNAVVDGSACTCAIGCPVLWNDMMCVQESKSDVLYKLDICSSYIDKNAPAPKKAEAILGQTKLIAMLDDYNPSFKPVSDAAKSDN